MEAGWHAREVKIKRKTARGAGADNGAGNCGESSQEGALMNQGPGGRKQKEEKKKGDRHAPETSRRHDSASRARSPAPSALSSPGAQVGTLSRLKDTPLGPLGTGHPTTRTICPSLSTILRGGGRAQSQVRKEQKGRSGEPWKENVFRSLGALCSLRAPWKRGSPAGGRSGTGWGGKMGRRRTGGDWGGEGPGGGIARRG